MTNTGLFSIGDRLDYLFKSHNFYIISKISNIKSLYSDVSHRIIYTDEEGDNTYYMDIPYKNSIEELIEEINIQIISKKILL